MAKHYFTLEHERAIIEYAQETDSRKRNRIFEDRIYEALKHLVDSMFHNVYSADLRHLDAEQIKIECLSHIVLALDKFDPTRGKSAFSYLTVSAKNFYMQSNMKASQMSKRYSGGVYITEDSSVEGENSDSDTELIDILVQYWDKNVTKIFNSAKNILIAAAVVELLRRHKEFDNVGKLAMNRYIRAMTGCSTTEIKKVLAVMNKVNVVIVEKYRSESVHRRINRLIPTADFV